MWKKGICPWLALMVLVGASTTQGIVIGNWENQMDGWEILPNAPPGIIDTSYSATGATLGSTSLRMNVLSGWKWAIALKLQNAGLVDEFFRNHVFQVDVTRLVSDWTGSTGFTELQLTINANSGKGNVWQGKGVAGTWSPPDGNNTQTVSWDYSAEIARIDRNSVAWLEFWIITNNAAAYTSAVYYLDNAQLSGSFVASAPRPANGATNVSRDVVPSWTPGGSAATHTVYLGTDPNGVNNATTTVHPGVTVTTVDVNHYSPGPLEFSTTYYWRVDEVNGVNLWKGDVWSFTTGNFLVVDDMESYGTAETPGPPPPAGSRIWFTWKDGSGWLTPTPVAGNGTGSVVDPNGGIVHGGIQSLKFFYSSSGVNNFGDKGKALYSEIKADTSYLPIGRDWTKAGVKALTLWFYGNPENDANATEQMYVKLNGARVVYDGGMNDLKQATWHEWNIDLAKFVGVTLSNVTDIAIGFGSETNTTPGGTGVVFFDDIVLNRPRCILSARTAAFAKVDYAPSGNPVGDCVVNAKELTVMAQDWLLRDAVIPTQNPGSAGLLAYYLLDEGTGTAAADASGNGLNGNLRGGVTWTTPGLMGNSAIHVDSTAGAMVDIGTWDPAATGRMTLSIWTRWGGPASHGLSQGMIGKRDEWDATGALRFMFEITNTGQIRLGQYSSNVFSAAGTMVPFIGQWAHVAATYDGTTARLYRNGREVISGAFVLGDKVDASMAIGNTTGAMGWGGTGNGPEAFNGDLDEARIYSRALSATEVAYLADTTPGDGQLHAPVPSSADLYGAEAPGSQIVDFKDYAVLMSYWLQEQLWP